MNKEQKRAALAEYKRKQKEAFLASLPMPEPLFRELFDYLDKRLLQVDCRHNFRHTRDFLQGRVHDTDAVLEWLLDHGAGCDCEVLYNVEDQFDN